MGQILNMGNSYDTSKPILDVLRDECYVGDFKLSDNIFVEICEAYNKTEDEVMEEMCKQSNGKKGFVRVENGWIYLD